MLCLLVGQIFAQGTPDILTNPISGTFCPRTALNIGFTITGTFNPGNTFTAELSDENGDFQNATEIGQITGTTSGAMLGMVPLYAEGGNGYRIRVVASDPQIEGQDNGVDIEINPLPGVSPEIDGPEQICAGQEEVMLECG